MKSPSDMSANALRYTPATEHRASLRKRILPPRIGSAATEH